MYVTNNIHCSIIFISLMEMMCTALVAVHCNLMGACSQLRESSKLWQCQHHGKNLSVQCQYWVERQTVAVQHKELIYIYKLLVYYKKVYITIKLYHILGYSIVCSIVRTIRHHCTS